MTGEEDAPGEISFWLGCPSGGDKLFRTTVKARLY